MSPSFASFVQLRQSQLELQEVQVSHRQLAARLEELTDEHSLQSLTPHPSSLLCEIEQSMEQEEQEQEREQVLTAGVCLICKDQKSLSDTCFLSTPLLPCVSL